MKQFSIKMLKKEEKNTENMCAPGNRSCSSGFVARQANHEARLCDALNSCPYSRDSATIVFVTRVNVYGVWILTELHLSVISAETISSDKMSKDISDTL